MTEKEGERMTMFLLGAATGAVVTAIAMIARTPKEM